MESAIKIKSFDFAIRIVNLRKYLTKNFKEYSLSDQVLRSGTSIGANVCEGEYAQSRADFISKMSIALKEAGETEYWLKLLYYAKYIDTNMYDSIIKDCKELCRILQSIIKTTKDNNKNKC
jgi:four helix bundle protein